VKNGLLVVLSAVIGCLLADQAFALDITACGQTVPRKQIGILQADLSCDPNLAVAINVQGQGKVMLNGHAISGAKAAIACNGTCKVSGPGEISGTGFGVAQLGLRQKHRARVTVENLSIHDGPYDFSAGVQMDFGQVFVLRNLTLERNAVGICCDGHVEGNGLTISDNRDEGVEASFIDLNNFSVTGNGGIGIKNIGRSIYPKRHSVTLLRNGTMSNNQPIDISTFDRPIVRNVACEHSQSPSGTWGICSGD